MPRASEAELSPYLFMVTHFYPYALAMTIAQYLIAFVLCASQCTLYAR